MKTKLLVVLAMALFPAYVLGVDGVTLINQSTLNAAGGTYTITASGSYKLSGNLQAKNLNTNVIEVAASNVTIDLNGFAIIGPGHRGIDSTDSGVFKHITVFNGSLRGLTIGISLGDFARIENVHVSDGFYGIEVGNGSILIGNILENNGFVGITASVSMLRANVAVNNNNMGIQVFCPASIVGNSAWNNGGGDIVIAGTGCTLAQNSPAP